MNIAKPGETQEMYQKNLDLLPQRLKDAVLNITDEEFGRKVEIKYNEDGYPVCLYHRDGTGFHITSRHPLREADAWGRSIHVEGASVIFLYGSGFGYALFELFAKKSPQALVVLFEQDVCLFKAMLYCFDLSPLIATHKFMIFTGDGPSLAESFSKLFAHTMYFVNIYPAVLFTYPAARNFKNEYLNIHRAVFKELSFVTACIGNSHQDDMLGLRNLLANANEVLKNPYLSCMKDKCPGVTAIIVSNGPSLDKSIPLLRKIQGKCLMICAESAIITLTKNGIRPDIMAVLERTKANYTYHFENRHHSPDIALFALAMVDPRIFPSFDGEKIPIFRQGEGQNRWLNQHIGDGSALPAGASVAHLAAQAAIYLGADPIIFVGQDFAYGSNGATHSNDAAVSQEIGKRERNFFHSLPTVYLEGNNGEMIPSNPIWANFLTGMEEIILKHPEHHFYNATEGGAKIKGTEKADFSQLIERFCNETVKCRINELIAEEKAKISVPERSVKLKKLTADIENYAVLFRKLARETNLKKLESERMMMLCAGKDEEKYQDILDETYRRNTDSFYRYMSDALCSFFFQRFTCAYFYLLNSLGVIDTKGKRMQVFDIHRQFFRDLRVVSQSVSVTLEESVRTLKSASEEIKGKNNNS